MSAGERRSSVSRGHGAKLLRRQELAIIALIEADTLEGAAQRANIHVSTLRRWIADERFAGQYQSAKRRLLDSAIVRLRKLARKAVDTLETIATNDKNPAAARTAAAGKLLDSALKVATFEDLKTRLDVLERKYEERKWKR